MAKSTPEQMLKTMLANLPEKTGRSLDAWFAELEAHPFAKHGEIVKWLKGEHGVTHGFANLISQQFLSRGEATTDLVAAQYSGAKASLRPIYDAVVATVQKFGTDVDIAPKKTYVSLRRSKQFALIQPSTKTRVDLGINLKGVPADGRLEKSGSFNAMVSHRVRLGKTSDIDKQVRQWLKAAFDAA
ncbi:MAG: DUF4287 domain-containing protein [Pseudomonadota bacterium]